MWGNDGRKQGMAAKTTVFVVVDLYYVSINRIKPNAKILQDTTTRYYIYKLETTVDKWKALCEGFENNWNTFGNNMEIAWTNLEIVATNLDITGPLGNSLNYMDISVRMDKMTKRWPQTKDSLRQAELVFRDAEWGMPRVDFQLKWAAFYLQKDGKTQWIFRPSCEKKIQIDWSTCLFFQGGGNL